MSKLRVYIGWDSREEIAYEVAKQSLLRNATIDVEVIPIKQNELVSSGNYTRDIDPLASTEFTYSRFFTPWLAGFEGWALFCDCDFLFFGDVAELLQYCDDAKAVACVKHDYTPKETTKMDGQVQTVYPRKNWSSFMLFNCAHPSTKQLTPELINRESGAFLHRMQWARDEEISEIPAVWNWLEGWYDVADTGSPKAIHYTSGGPWFEDYQDVEFGDEWRAEAEQVYNRGILSRNVA